MMAVKTSWQRFGRPAGLFSELEERHGIHGGDVETSLMLHFRPDLVDMDAAQNFASSVERAEAEFELLRPTGTHAFAWIATDLNPPVWSARPRLPPPRKAAPPPSFRPTVSSACSATSARHDWPTGCRRCSARASSRDAPPPADGAQHRRQVAAIGDLDAFELEPRRHRRQLAEQRLRRVGREPAPSA